MLLERLQLFIKVAKYQNLGKTARGIHVSASSVCQRLKALENDFGVKLYKRSKRGIELTRSGQILVASGTDLLERLDDLKRQLNSKLKNEPGSLAIGATLNPSAKHLPSAIAAFQKRYPDVKVTFLSSVRANIEKALRESEIEVAVIQNPSDSADFVMEPFASDSLLLFAHPKHPLARKKQLTLADLKRTSLVIREGRGSIDMFLQQLKSRGFRPNVALRCVSPDALKAAVRKKLGVGILFRNQLEEEIRRKQLTVLRFRGLPAFIANSYIVYSKHNPLSGVAANFVAVLRSMKSGPKKISTPIPSPPKPRLETRSGSGN